MAKIEFKAVNKCFGQDTIVPKLDLTINDGEFMVFVGPSGCGKSTILRLIAGLEDITDGEIFIDENKVNNIIPAKRGAAMVFQNYALYPHMTVADNLSFGIKMAGINKVEIKEIVDETAQTLQIKHLLDYYPKQLSGGQRQRVAIGRAIVRRPKVFLFDEPLSNLDASLRVQMRIELAKLHNELKTTMIYVTHDQIEAMTLGNRICVFNKGQIEQVGTPLALYQKPANLFVAQFLGSPKMNIIEYQWDEISKQIKLDPNYTVDSKIISDNDKALANGKYIAIRPEHLALSKGKEAKGLTAIVDFIETLGDCCIIFAKLLDQQIITVRLSIQETTLKTGDKINLLPNPKLTLIYDNNNLLIE